MENPANVDVKTLLTFCALLVTFVGGVIARDRQVSAKISNDNSKTHSRIDDLKDDMNENFARKDDVRESVKRVERSIESLGVEMRQNHKDLTALIIKNENWPVEKVDELSESERGEGMLGSTDK